MKIFQHLCQWYKIGTFAEIVNLLNVSYMSIFFLSAFVSEGGRFLQQPRECFYFENIPHALAAILWVTPTGNGVCTCTDSRTEFEGIPVEPRHVSVGSPTLIPGSPVPLIAVCSAGRSPFHAAVSQD